MGHSLKIKCVDSRVNVHILASASVTFYTDDDASANFSTNSHETGNSVVSKHVLLILLLRVRNALPLSKILQYTESA
jgi:hypothetical protein